MENHKSYSGIDYFRVISAFLIVAVHTSPLTSISPFGDYILTCILARMAVPFFFMTSGFFLISRYGDRDAKLKKFLKRTTLLYVAAMILYLPLNVYKGDFAADMLLPEIIKDIVFDGTLYHLWYLPASVMGAAIAWVLVRKLDFRKAFTVTVILYIIGLLGDSYYGFAQKLPFLEGFYRELFQIMEHTRNGIFFAPVFFVLGGMIANRPVPASSQGCLAGCVAFAVAMVGEGLILQHFGIPRHDSMYLLLLPVMYCGFTAITFWQGQGPRVWWPGPFALVIYLIHPMVIVMVRMLSQLAGMPLLIQNSLVHYLAVSTASTGFAIAVIVLMKKGKSRHENGSGHPYRAWVEINLEHLEHNVRILQAALPSGCELMAVVKAEGYGHGALAVSSHLNRLGVKDFAVATIDEGIALRRYGIRGEILILGYTHANRAKELHRYHLTQTVIDFNHGLALNRQRIPLKVHLKIDTGMHRLGFSVNNVDEIIKVCGAKFLHIKGIYTHLGVCGSLAAEDKEFTGRQIGSFDHVLHQLAENQIRIPKNHIQSSYGLLNYPQLRCHYVRAGISLYGASASPGTATRLQLDLRPVLSLRTQIVLIRKIAKGESAGYDRAYVADRDSLIAILPVGYADGLPRSLSCGKGKVLIRGCLAPIAGMVCMDQMAVDITDIPQAALGDVVTLIGQDGPAMLTAAEVAKDAGSIANELLSRMGSRLKVIYTGFHQTFLL